jgi:signal transduction histidine kinase
MLAVMHNVKNCLASIKLSAQLMERRLQDTLPDSELAGRIDHIQTSCRQAAEILNDAADTWQVLGGKPLCLHPQSTDLRALALAAVERQQPRSPQTHISFSCSGSVTGEWDVQRLRRMLAELLDNAVQFTSPDGVISVELETAADNGRRWAVLRVRDDGIGIGEGDMPYIFDRLFRGSNTTGTSKGQGIGLAMAAQIAQQHGGTILADSAPGQGAVFTVWLPR